MRALGLGCLVLMQVVLADRVLASEAEDLRRAIDVVLSESPRARFSREVTPDFWRIGGAGEEEKWTREFGVGLSLAQGNSDHFDLHVDGNVVYESAPWAFGNKGSFIYGEADGTRSAESWHTQHRVERDIADRTFAFAQLIFDRDELAGLEYRLTGLAGVGRTLAKGPNGFLKGEVGGGVVNEKRLGLPSTTSPSAYVGIDAERTWVDGSKLTIEYDFVPNLDDFDLSFMTWDLKYAKPVCAEIDITIGIRLDYVFGPPGTAEELDILMTVGLQIRL